MFGSYMVFAVFVLLVSGCGANVGDTLSGDDSEVRDHVDQQRSVHRENITAPRLEREFGFISRTKPTGSNEMYMGAIGGGTLVVDRDDCLRLGENGDLPVWPYEYSLVTRGGDLVILNGKDQIEARVGDRVEVGGGQITKGESSGGYEEKRRELNIPDRCRGPLWYVSPGVRVKESEREENTVAETSDIAPVSPEEVGLAFPQERTRSRDSMGAYGGGKLIVQDGCIHLGANEDKGSETAGSDLIIVWPYGYSLGKRDGEIYILNEKGEAKAKIGDEVGLGGGIFSSDPRKAPTDAARRRMEERRREFGVPKQCRGPLWGAAPGINVIEAD